MARIHNPRTGLQLSCPCSWSCSGSGPGRPEDPMLRRRRRGPVLWELPFPSHPASSSRSAARLTALYSSRTHPHLEAGGPQRRTRVVSPSFAATTAAPRRYESGIRVGPSHYGGRWMDGLPNLELVGRQRDRQAGRPSERARSEEGRHGRSADKGSRERRAVCFSARSVADGADDGAECGQLAGCALTAHATLALYRARQS